MADSNIQRSQTCEYYQNPTANGVNHTAASSETAAVDTG